MNRLQIIFFLHNMADYRKGNITLEIELSGMLIRWAPVNIILM